MRRALPWLLCALALAPDASGEAVGSMGVGRAALGGSPRIPPRAAALEAALADAVRQAAEGLVGQATGPSAEATLDAALGSDPGRFALTYRTVSEREETRTAASGRELVLTVEAQVDRARLSAALRRAGLLAAESAAPVADGLQRIVIEPVPAWSALTTLRRRFVELGAQRVLLEQVERGRVVLAVEGRGAESLTRAVIAAPPPGIRVEAAGTPDGVPRIRLERAPLAPAEAPAPIDTPAAKR